MSHEPIICEKHGMTSCLDCYRPTIVKIELEPTPEEFWASLKPERRLALAKAAPRVAGRWEDVGANGNGNRCSVRANFHEDRAFLGVGDFAQVMGPRFGKWKGIVPGALVGEFDSPESAQSACDAELIRLGYVLEGRE